MLLSIVFDHLNVILNEVAEKFTMNIHSGTNKHRELIQRVLTFMDMSEEEGFNALTAADEVDGENLYAKRLSEGYDYLEYIIARHFTDNILPFSQYIIEKYVYSNMYSEERSILYIDEDSRNRITRAFNKNYPGKCVCDEVTKLAFGAASIIYQYLHESLMAALGALTILPEIQEAFARTEPNQSKRTMTKKASYGRIKELP